ncbi:M50 family metallopeptidase [Kordiimonas laminariae]|uniref:M50 family metallopeptidase n=1 Tax=Kordiimonas laminariae TaxID=2917717 RepID=UPI001FF2247D|nr:M50 family metallopeptidase [Kordiimonas laminariae]
MNKIVKSILKLSAFAVVGAVIGASAAAFADFQMPDLGLSKTVTVISLILAIPIGLFTSILFHELGHMLFGVLAGMKAHAFIVGPFQWTFEDNRRLPSFELTASFNGGMALCKPSSPDAPAREFTLLIIGGPVASFLLTGVCILALPYTDPVTTIFLGMTAGISFFLGTVNLYPQTIGNLHTDGGRLLINLKGGKKAAEMNAQVQMSSYLFTPGSPKDWPETLIKTLQNAEEHSPEWLAGQYYGYTLSVLNQNWKEARTYLDKLLEKIEDRPAYEQVSYQQEEGLFLAISTFDFEAAKAKLNLREKTLFTSKHTKEIYHAIHYVADANYEDALLSLQKAEDLIPQGHFKGLRELSEIEIKIIRGYIEEQRKAA